MKCLLDTHFLVWLIMESRRLREFPWLDRYQQWGISPISLLELQLLREVGRIEIDNPDFTESLLDDPRFDLDEVPILALTRHALELTWTRDPFDRLLAAHSAARRVPLITVDRVLHENHKFLANELRPTRRRR